MVWLSVFRCSLAVVRLIEVLYHSKLQPLAQDSWGPCWVEPYGEPLSLSQDPTLSVSDVAEAMWLSNLVWWLLYRLSSAVLRDCWTLLCRYHHQFHHTPLINGIICIRFQTGSITGAARPSCLPERSAIRQCLWRRTQEGQSCNSLRKNSVGFRSFILRVIHPERTFCRVLCESQMLFLRTLLFACRRAPSCFCYFLALTPIQCQPHAFFPATAASFFISLAIIH